jgi:alpha-beta hydrolase superfamily lysophospholipase
VHGSGPQDRDETILGNKPFRDLAWGLASKGIAVLRYEKVTRAHPGKLDEVGKVTLDEETVNDAVLAVQKMMNVDKIDEDRVFVVGHSLGAFAAPRILERGRAIRGAVMLAGNYRPLEDLIVEQYTYLFSQKGELTPELKKKLEEIKQKAARVKEPDLKRDVPKKELLMNIPAEYWLSLRAYDQKVTAEKLKQPLLILQGERDYQVRMTDFTYWQKALAEKKNATLKSYPALNHLFMKGEGKSTPEEYQKQGHVEEQVLDDIVAWIRGLDR